MALRPALKGPPGIPMTTSHAPFLPAILSIALIAGGCTSLPPPSSAMVEVEWVNPDTTPLQLRIWMFEYYTRFSAAIENAADRIMAASEDREVRRAALQWKIDAIGEAQLAAFRADPFGALLDSWSFCAQMEEYLTDGDGKDLFGPEQETARAVTAEMQGDIANIGRLVARDGDVSVLSAEMEDSVLHFPIEGSLSLRRAPLEEYAHLISQTHSLAGVAADLNQQVTDLSRRMTFYAVSLPRQARWEAELLVDDHLDTLVNAVDRVAGVLEQVPEIVDTQRSAITELVREERETVLAAAVEAVATERVALTDAVSAQLQVVLESVDQQRLDTIVVLTQERQAVLEALSGERMAVVEVVDAEREEMVRALREERREAMEELEAMSNRLLTASLPPAESLVDYVFIRVLQVLGLVLVLGVLVGAIALRVYRRTGPGRTPATPA